MRVIKSIKLFFQEGTSDKVYNATIEEEEGVCTVRVEWGRRGAPLNQGTKAVRVPLAAAEKAYDKVVREKRGKGYEEITESVQPAAVAPPVGEGSASRSGRPGRARLPQAAQLLNAIEDRELERLLDDDFYLAQQKLDGMRVLSHVGDSVVATNRKGEVIALDVRLQEALAAQPAGTVLDGEVVEGDGGPTYWLFDLLRLEGEDLRPRGYHERYGRLQGLELDGPLRLVTTARNAAQKRELYERLRAEHAEGIVFKRDDAPYTPGRPASGGTQLKYKFVKTADVFITANAGNAYQMAVYDGARVHEAGRVFAGTTNETRRQLDELLAAGETPVAEVKYLYATDDDILYQPVFVQLRDDKDPADCSIGQLVRTSRDAVVPAPRQSAPTGGKSAPAAAKPKGERAPAASTKGKGPAASAKGKGAPAASARGKGPAASAKGKARRR